MSQVIKLSTTPLRQVQNVQGLLMNDQAREQLAAVAASHMTPERMMRVVANAIRTTPLLQQCEPIGFLGALMQCASLGLEPNTLLGHAYLIPFKNTRKNVVEVQVIIGYKGYIDLARRSGNISSIQANIHYSDDKLWEYEEGTEARLRHIPADQEGDPLHAYAIAKFRDDGGHAYVVLPWKRVIKVRDGSSGYKSAIQFKKDHPWISHEGAMAKKTAIRELSKYLPLSVEFHSAMGVDGLKADYRAFALNPHQGLDLDPEDGDGDGDEGNAGGNGGATQGQRAGNAGNQVIEGEVVPPTDQTGPQQSAPAAQQAAPAAQQRAQQSAPAAQQRAPAPQQAAPSEGAELAALQQVYDRIAGDLLDGAPPAETLQMFAAEIAQMKAKAKGIYKALKAEVADYAPDLLDTF